MKKYRIKNYGTLGYVVQERILLFAWHTLSKKRFSTLIFNSVEEAKDYIDKVRKDKTCEKKAKYIEYV